jgi:hypothetical protein
MLWPVKWVIRKLTIKTRDMMSKKRVDPKWSASSFLIMALMLS